MPEEYGLLLGIAVSQWGKWREKVGLREGRPHRGYPGRWGRRKSRMRKLKRKWRSKQCKEGGGLYKVSFHAEFLLRTCDQGWCEVPRTGRAAGAYTGGCCGPGLVSLRLPPVVSSLFSWSFYIRKKEVSRKLCAFFAFGACLPGFQQKQVCHVWVILYRGKRKDTTEFYSPFGCPSRMTFLSLRNHIYCPFWNQTLDTSEEANELEVESWHANSWTGTQRENRRGRGGGKGVEINFLVSPGV